MSARGMCTSLVLSGTGSPPCMSLTCTSAALPHYKHAIAYTTTAGLPGPVRGSVSLGQLVKLAVGVRRLESGSTSTTAAITSSGDASFIASDGSFVMEDTSTSAPTPTPTLAPTTASPTTVQPTTAAPTTAAPSTAKPTTAAPVTASPTTAAPTTAGKRIASEVVRTV
jgi:hypothetical protein